KRDTEVVTLMSTSPALSLPRRIRWGLTAAAASALLALLVVLATFSATAPNTTGGSSAATSGIASAPLVRLAHTHPGRAVEAIVQFENGTKPASAHRLVRAAGGRVTGELPI